MLNLLTTPIISTLPGGLATLPQVVARLTRDEVDSFPALRPHQAPAWHMLLVQMAALAMHRGGKDTLPRSEEEWRDLFRGLTVAFPDDEPWSLVVADHTKPAFLQPPVPTGQKMDTELATPDASDVLITARNHDIKQQVMVNAAPEDWLFALVSLQTMEGFSGRANYGIARMNGGSSSRVLFGLAPMPDENEKSNEPRHGSWFARDVAVLLATREQILDDYDQIGFAEDNGIGLTWLASWPLNGQLHLKQLDPWFIEACRRIRLSERQGQLFAQKGTSLAERIAAKHLNGALGDPWAPVHKTESKSLTLGSRSFDYTMILNLLSAQWRQPILAQPAPWESGQAMLLVAAAMSRGNSKTEGFKSRVLPIGGKVSKYLKDDHSRETISVLAAEQAKEIKTFKDRLKTSLALVAAGGEWESVGKASYERAYETLDRLDHEVDGIFFEHLWARLEAREAGEGAANEAATAFRKVMYERTRALFMATLPSIPSRSLFRPRAESRARSFFFGTIYRDFPDLRSKDDEAELQNDDHDTEEMIENG